MSIYRRKIRIKATTNQDSNKSTISKLFNDFSKPVIGFGLIALLLAFSFAGFKFYRKQQTERLAERLYFDFKKTNSFSADNDYSYVHELDNNTGFFGSIKLADLYFSKGEYENALKEYKRVGDKSKNKLLKLIGRIGTGYAYEGNSEYDKAIKVFDELKESIPDSSAYVPYKMIAHISLARCYEESGDIQQALKQYNNFKTSYPDSQFKDKVDFKIENLTKNKA